MCTEFGSSETPDVNGEPYSTPVVNGKSTVDDLEALPTDPGGQRLD
jgi:hypothetical protein